jgi:hypothetical protein
VIIKEAPDKEAFIKLVIFIDIYFPENKNPYRVGRDFIV